MDRNESTYNRYNANWRYADVTNKLKTDSDRMKHDRITYYEREMKPNGITAKHTNLSDKVIFVANPYLLFFESQRTLHTLPSPTSQRSNQSLPKSAIYPTPTIQNLEYYGRRM